MTVEDIGNNTYKMEGHSEALYAPNLETAKKKFRNKLMNEFNNEIGVLDKMLFHRGFKLARQQLADIVELHKKLCDE